MEKELMDIISKIVPEIDFGEGVDLGDCMGSLEMLELMVEIEDRFGIIIPIEEKVASNFKDIDSIRKMIEKEQTK